MLFHLDFRAEELAAAPQAVLQECISEAVRAHRLGHHLVVLNRDAADYLLSTPGFSAVERNTISRLRSEYTQTADLVRRARFRVRVGSLPPGTIRGFDDRVELSIDQAIRPSIFDKTMLVIEDEPNDGALYAFLFDNLRDIFKTPPYQCEWVHGGGDRTGHVAAARATERRLVCVVVDTDANSPRSQESTKLRALRDIGGATNWPLIFVKTTPCREIENLIGLELVSILDCAQSRDNEFRVLRRIESEEFSRAIPLHDAFLLYYDFKLGCDFDKIRQSMSVDELAWYTGKLSLVLTNEAEYALAGFGAGIVAQAMRDNSARARLRAEIRKNAWLQIFGDFVEDILWLCVGGRRQFT